MNKLKQRLWAVAVAVVMSAVWAAGQTKPDPAVHPVAVHAARLLDVRSGRTITDQIIVIENERVVSITPSAQAKVPPVLIVSSP